MRCQVKAPICWCSLLDLEYQKHVWLSIRLNNLIAGLWQRWILWKHFAEILLMCFAVVTLLYPPPHLLFQLNPLSSNLLIWRFNVCLVLILLDFLVTSSALSPFRFRAFPSMTSDQSMTMGDENNQVRGLKPKNDNSIKFVELVNDYILIQTEFGYNLLTFKLCSIAQSMLPNVY